MFYKIDTTRRPQPNCGNLIYPIYKDDIKIASLETEFRGEDGEIVFNDGKRVSYEHYRPWTDVQIEGNYYEVRKDAIEIIEAHLSRNK